MLIGTEEGFKWKEFSPAGRAFKRRRQQNGYEEPGGISENLTGPLAREIWMPHPIFKMP